MATILTAKHVGFAKCTQNPILKLYDYRIIWYTINLRSWIKTCALHSGPPALSRSSAFFWGVELAREIWVCMSQDMLRSGTADAASMANVLKAYKTTSQWQEAPWVKLSHPIVFSMPWRASHAEDPPKWIEWEHGMASVAARSMLHSHQHTQFQAWWHLFEVPSAFQLGAWDTRHLPWLKKSSDWAPIGLGRSGLSMPCWCKLVKYMSYLTSNSSTRPTKSGDDMVLVWQFRAIVWYTLPFHAVTKMRFFSEATSWHHYISVAESCSLQSSWQSALWLIFHSALPPEFRFSAAISACKNAMVKGRAYPVGL